MKKNILGLFEGAGIEIEYMITDIDSLNIKPFTDKVLKNITGKYVNECHFVSTAWSNELAAHVIEIKTNGPAGNLPQIKKDFYNDIKKINNILSQYNAMLMPTAMHPFMNPRNETVLWSHKYKSIYQKYHKIFNCYNHGWANLQSMHINLPFYDDNEFALLHSAIRIILPLIPVLSASSPVVEGALSGFADSRLNVYINNQKLVPSVSGKIIPEPVYTKKDYIEQILQPMYNDIKPFDSEGILQDEWLNSRGAIARFQRNAIEIRIIDTQECVGSDISIAVFVIGLLKYIIKDILLENNTVKNFPTDRLYNIFVNTIKEGSKSVIRDSEFLQIFSIDKTSLRASELLNQLKQRLVMRELLQTEDQNVIDFILNKGNLSERIIECLKTVDIKDIYRQLRECLAADKMFECTEKFRFCYKTTSCKTV